MQRYHAASCNSAVNNNNTIGGPSGRSDSSSIGNYSLNSRRPQPLTPYKLKCEKDGLSSRLGPPDFHPPTASCPEENLTKEYVQFGYKETVDGLEEAKEITLSQIHLFSNPVVLKCKEAVRKCLRAINESRVQKRKAGQVYGVPLSGSLLCKPGFPDQRACGEETRKRWIENLSQQHKRLCALADNVPNGYKRKSLFEVLIRNNVPVVRATWFVKVTYLNQVRPDKTQSSRSELWTKHVIEYLQFLLEELLTRNHSGPTQNTRDRSSSLMQKTAAPDGEEPSPHFKWWYMVRLIQWHNSQGLLLSNLIIDWALKLLQEKEAFEVVQLMLPIVYGVIESIVLSQTYVQTLAAIAIRYLEEPSPGGSDLVDNSRRAYTLSALVEMLRYLIAVAPDTFVASDCFPLPPSVAAFEPLLDSRGSTEVSYRFQGRGADSRFESISFDYIVSTIRRSADDLAKIASPDYLQHNEAKAVRALDKALLDGNIEAAYSHLFEKDDVSNGTIDEGCCWIAEVSPCLRSSLTWIGAVTSSFVSSIFFLLEWATCGFRDFRAGVPKDIKFTGRKDYSRVYLVIQLLKRKIIGAESGSHRKKRRNHFHHVEDVFESPGPLHDIVVCWIDQHEVQRGSKGLQLLIFELIRSGTFNPVAYARQLLVSGITAETDTERRTRHHRILKLLPGNFIHDTLEEAHILGGDKLSEAVLVFSNERRHVLRELLVVDTSTNRHLSDKKSKKSVEIRDLKELIAALLRFPGMEDSAGDDSRAVISGKRSMRSKTGGCEECIRGKRPKLNEEKSSSIQGIDSDEEEDNWWMRKDSRMLLESSSSFKLMRQGPRSRQKNVRKTQSLSQLQADRIEGSRGASTSHVCEHKVNCSHHGPTGAGDGFGASACADIVSIGKSLKQLRFVEKRAVAVWLMAMVRKLVEESEKRSSGMWKLGEEELSAIVHLMDAALDLVSLVKFLLWVLPKTSSSPSFSIQGGRNLVVVPRNVDNHACDVGEAFLVSSLRRYENIIISADLVSEALSVLMARAATIVSRSGRSNGSAALIYARYLLKKHASLATCDKRLLSELDHIKSDGGGEYGTSLGVPAGVENPDDYLRQKISATRPSRVGLTMREVVQHIIEEATHGFRKLIGSMRGSMAAEKKDDGYPQRIIIGLMGCIKQTGGAAQEGDPSLVASAVSAIVNSAGSAVSRIPDLSLSNNGAVSFVVARYILRIHILCLCHLKEALGERQSRVFEIALTTECSTAFAAVFAPAKASRAQLSPESYDSNAKLTNETHLNRATKVTAAVSALVMGAITHGVITLERIVSLLRLNECLDFVQFVKTSKSSSNGNSRSGVGAFKVENSLQVYVHWFRLLVGNSRTVCEGLLMEFVGNPSVAAISQMQRLLPLDLVFLPAYAIFAFLLWKPLLVLNSSSSSSTTQEDTHRLYQSLTMAINDAIRHLPFRDVCLRNTRELYDLIASDPTDAEFASVLELTCVDLPLKPAAFVPLRARLFLDAIVDSKMSQAQEVVYDAKTRHQGNGTKLLNKIMSVLDSLQPAKFHWQWVELRLLLNEQALIDKLDNHNMPLVEAIRSSCPSSEKLDAFENEKNFIELILTKLLVRPDAAPLFSELVHLFGRSVEDSMLKQAEWFLAGQDVLLGRKTIKQKLIKLAESKSYPTKPVSRRPWGCYDSGYAPPPPVAVKTETNTKKKKTKKKKMEVTCIEEGEVVEEGKESRKMSARGIDQASGIGHEMITETAFVQLVLPCIDHCSNESRTAFLNELTKQFSILEKEISSVTRNNPIKQPGTISSSSGAEVSSIRASTRKGIKSSNIAKRSSSSSTTITNTHEMLPLLSPAALRASMSLRLHFLLRLLPVICGDSSNRAARHTLASIIIRLLGSRVVYEDSAVSSSPSFPNKPSNTETESMVYPSTMVNLCSEALFDRFLYVLHGLLSNHQPHWLKPRSTTKPLNDSPKDFEPFDRDVTESLQYELERMQLPDTIRWRIQAAMPILIMSRRCSVSCHPQTVPATSLALVQPSSSGGGFNPGASLTPSLRNPNTAQGRLKQKAAPQLQQQQEMGNIDIDPWMLLEDGTGSGPSSIASNIDHSNLRAAGWLKGTVRVRRTNLTYIGPVDEDS